MASENQTQTQYWRVSPGERGYLWREQKLHECIAIGWNETGSAKGKSRPWLRRALKDKKKFEWRPGAHAFGQLEDFIWNIRKGDKVVASTSGGGIYALGTVVGDYEYNRNLWYRHSRKVAWETTFWSPVKIKSLDLREDVYNKFHGRSSYTIRSLEPDQWNHFTDRLRKVRTPFRNLAMWGGLIQSPEYEGEVIILFTHMLQHFGMRIASIGTRFPDAIVERKKNGTWRTTNVEFELRSSRFCCHMPACDNKGTFCRTIVCWEDDWTDRRKKSRFEIIELKRELEKIL
ncbi:MAG: hypothetical protein KGS61_14450 [Verrucomicrobia bacterium]|nr:hypothetical protein [Verrucomicrobiota bacterium]